MYQTLQRLLIPIGIVVMLCTGADAQRWRHTLDFSVTSSFQDMVVLEDGSIIALVNADSIYLVKLSASGTELWRKNIQMGVGIVLERLGDNLFLGGSNGTNFLKAGILIKIGFDGQIIWTRTYDTGYISAITGDDDGIFIGGKLDNVGATSNAVLYKIDFNGGVQWMSDYSIYSNSGVVKILNKQEDLVLVLDASVVGAGFDGTVVLSVSRTDGQVRWRQDKAVGYYNSFLDLFELPRPMDASLNDSSEIVISVPAHAFGGSKILRYSSEGDLLAEFKIYQGNAGTLPHEIEILDDGEYLIAGILDEPTTDPKTLIERRTASGTIEWQRTIDTGAIMTLSVVGDTIIAAGVNRDFRRESDYRPYIIKMTTDGRVYDSGIQLTIAEDVNDNCAIDSTDSPLEDIRVKIDRRIFTSGADGKISLDVDTGYYDIDITLPPYLKACNQQDGVHVLFQDEIVDYEAAITKEDCADLSVGVTYTEFIRGSTSRVYVQFNNRGSVDVSGAILDIALDDRAEIEDVSSDFINTTDGIQLALPLIPANSSDRIWLDIFVDEQLDLYSSICIEASISPRSTCDAKVAMWNGPDLELEVFCENDEAVVRVTNAGGAMTEDVPYTIFADGYGFEKGTLRLDAQAQQIFKIVPNGSTVSCLTHEVQAHPLYSRITASVEGCGVVPGGTRSKGFARMFETASPIPWISKACLEVRDHYSTDRTFEIGRGLGRYHVTDTTSGRHEFSIMYKNDTDNKIDQLEFFIEPSTHFDILTFKESAASHHFINEILPSGIVHLAAQNLNLEVGSEIQYRFELELKLDQTGQTFVQVNVNGIIDGQTPVSIYPGFYNANAEYTIESISPFISVPSGRVIGRGHSFDFHSDLVSLGDVKFLHGGTTSDPGQDYRMLLTTVDSDDNMIWQHAIVFNEGGVLLRKIIPVNDKLILAIGSVDDKTIPNNYIDDSYAFLLALDHDGNEVWRRVWKPGTDGRIGGSLLNGLVYSDEKIILTGFRYNNNIQTQFLMEINSMGETNWTKDFVFQGGSYAFNKVDMRMTPQGNMILGDVDYDNDAYNLIEFDQNGNEMNATTYSDDIEMRVIAINGFNVTDSDMVVLVGDGYSYDDDFNFNTFGYLVYLDKNLDFVKDEKILEDIYIVELRDIVSRSDFLYLAGSMQKDTASSRNAVIVKTDMSGTTHWIKERDFGARDYAYDIILDTNDRIYAGVQTQTIDRVYNLQMGYFSVADSVVTATEEVSYQGNDIKVFPNPASLVINIASEFAIVRINAFSIDGGIIALPELGDGAYSIGHLPSGNYFLVIYDQAGTRHLSRFVKID
jgi:PQQ-like domain